MASYVVTWSIDVEDVACPEDAAVKALEIQRDPESTATVFEVQKVVRRFPFLGSARSILGPPVEVYL